MVKRHVELLELLLARGRLTVDQLSAHFKITGMTVRRDLAELERQGLLTRTHGGCVLRAAPVQELPFREKEGRNREAKEAIARAVVARLADGDSLYLDTGTSCAMVAALLPAHRRRLQVFTNNLPAALALFGAAEIAVVILGGGLGQRSPDLTGDLALARLADLRFDLAVVGGDALDAEAGEFYAADLATAALSRAAQRQAERTFLCLDSSKVGKRALAVCGRLDDRLAWFTDAALPAAARQAVRRHGSELVLAKPPTGSLPAATPAGGVGASPALPLKT